MEKKLFKPFLILFVLMSITVFALAYGVNVNLSFTPGVLMNLPDEVGDWAGNELRFCHNPNEFGESYHNESYYLRDLLNPKKCPDCDGELFNCTLAEKEQLPSDTEFVKSAYTNHQGSLINTSIVLSGTARDSIHRPQRCLKGQGHNLDSEYTIEIPISGRKPLSVRIIKTSRIFQTSEGEIPYYGYYAYWFVGQFRETPYHLERMFWLAWDRVVNSTANRWAYIAVSGKREIDDNSFEDDIISFVQQVYPNILTKDLHSKIYALK